MYAVSKCIYFNISIPHIEILIFIFVDIPAAISHATQERFNWTAGFGYSWQSCIIESWNIWKQKGPSRMRVSRMNHVNPNMSQFGNV